MYYGRLLADPRYSRYMTARDAGGIACRVFALYLGMVAFQGLVTLVTIAQSGPFGTRFSSATGRPPAVIIAEVLIVAFAAVLLWVKAPSFWPHDNVIVSSAMTAQQWIKVFVLLFGIYLVVTSCSIPLLAFFKATLQTTINWPDLRGETIFVDSVKTLVGIGLIVYGSTGWKGEIAE